MNVKELRPTTFLLHADYGDGKSWLAQTAPGKKLVLDVEGGAEYTIGRKTTWDNPNDPPPDMKDFDTCIVIVKELDTVLNVFRWLQVGRHPFDTVIVDSLSELQKRIVDEIAGVEQLAPRDWGELFRRSESLVRKFRDLKTNPVKPVTCIVFTAGATERGRTDEAVKLEPYVQGQLGRTLVGFPDIVGYLKVEQGETGPERKLYVQKLGNYAAKDRTHTFLDGFVDVTYDEDKGEFRNTLESMMKQVTETLARRERGEAA